VEVTFLSVDDILVIHERQITKYGGDPGLRDEGLLLSAIAQPEAAFSGDFLHPTLHDMAAAYLFHIVRNHPFVDGNKRTGSASALVFLAFNGYRFVADEDGFADMVLDVVAGKIDKSSIAEYLRQYTQPA